MTAAEATAKADALVAKAPAVLVAAKARAAFLIPLLGAAVTLFATGSREATIIAGMIAILSAIIVYRIPNAEDDDPGRHAAE